MITLEDDENSKKKKNEHNNNNNGFENVSGEQATSERGRSSEGGVHLGPFRLRRGRQETRTQTKGRWMAYALEGFSL